MKSIPPIFLLVGLAALALGSIPFSSAAEGEGSGSSTTQLRNLLDRFNETQQATRSLTASFTERKNLSLLAKPMVSTGTMMVTFSFSATS